MNLSRMIDEVYNRSQRRCENKKELMEAINGWKAKPHSVWSICSGHDLTAILGKALLSLFGSNSAQSSRVEEIESKLRMAFGLDDLRATGLFAAVVEWERMNPPYLIWRANVRAGPQQ